MIYWRGGSAISVVSRLGGGAGWVWVGAYVALGGRLGAGAIRVCGVGAGGAGCGR